MEVKAVASEFDDDFISEGEIEAHKLERAVFGEETIAQQAERLIQEGSVAAARTLVHLATNASVNDRVRLTASTYIIDRVCGRIGDAARNDSDAPWIGVFAAVTREIEKQ
jgi:hypothetical protein